jgi:hypothetical protein
MLAIVILLFSLLLIFVFLAKKNQEGFVTFQQDKNPLTHVIVPPYSTDKKVVKIYDNLFIDFDNYNLIEVNSAKFTTGSSSDTTGSSISSVWVVPPCSRAVCSSQSIATGNVDFSLAQQAMPSGLLLPWSYVTQTSSAVTDMFQLFFVPTLQSVLVYVVNLASMKSLTLIRSQKGSIEDAYFVGDDSFRDLGSLVAGSDSANNGKLVVEQLYDPTREVFQITSLVKFDFQSEKLLVLSLDSSTLTIYDADKNSVSSSTPATANRFTSYAGVHDTFSPWTIYDDQHHLILFVPVDNDYSSILLFQVQTNQLSLDQSVTFHRSSGAVVVNGAATAASATTAPASSTATTAPSVTTTAPSSATPPQDVSSYFNWKNQMSNDYILKTELIPPVSPPCDTCNSYHSCPNCPNNTTGPPSFSDSSTTATTGPSPSYTTGPAPSYTTGPAPSYTTGPAPTLAPPVQLFPAPSETTAPSVPTTSPAPTPSASQMQDLWLQIKNWWDSVILGSAATAGDTGTPTDSPAVASAASATVRDTPASLNSTTSDFIPLTANFSMFVR